MSNPSFVTLATILVPLLVAGEICSDFRTPATFDSGGLTGLQLPSFINFPLSEIRNQQHHNML
jgi:hypothetical protein